MKKLNRKMKIILIISFLLITYSFPSWARYYENLEFFEGKAIIAEPIIKVESLQETIKTEINKETEIKEYKFVVKNYECAENTKRINEINFVYDIEIKNSNDKFPIKYELFDMENGKELLNGSNKVEGLEIEKNIQYEKEYKLQVSWESKENMSSEDNIDIVISASQKKG